MVERIARAVGYVGELPFGSRADRKDERVRRAELRANEIEWRPQTNLDQGLRRSIEFFRG